MRLTEEEYKDLIKGSSGSRIKKSKYHNRKVEYYDPGLKETITFDSEKERDYYLLLKDRERRGEIYDIKMQVPITIQEGFTMPDGSKVRAITYRADFYYKERIGRKIVGDKIISDDIKVHFVDVKGYRTEVYKLKKKLLAYKGYYIEEV